MLIQIINKHLNCLNFELEKKKKKNSFLNFKLNDFLILYNIPLRFLCFIFLFFCFNRIDSIIYLSFIFRNFCFADLADSSGRHLPTYKKSLGWQNFPSLWLVRSGLSCSSRFFLRVQGWDINYCRQTLQHNFRN